MRRVENQETQFLILSLLTNQLLSPWKDIYFPSWCYGEDQMTNKILMNSVYMLIYSFKTKNTYNPYTPWLLEEKGCTSIKIKQK